MFVVESKDNLGNDVKVVVVKPGAKELEGARLYMNQTFRKSVESGAYLRSKVWEIMRSQGAWDDEKQKQLDELTDRIEENTKKLSVGGTISAGKEAALQLRRDRFFLNMLTAYQKQLDQFTVESATEDSNIDFLSSVCIRKENGDLVFNDVDDYKNRASEPFAIEAATKLAYILYNVDPDWQKKLPENQFLQKFGFMNDKLELIENIVEEEKEVPVLGEFTDEVKPTE